MDGAEPDDEAHHPDMRSEAIRRSCGPAPPPRRVVTWCHDCEGRGARWAPRGARLQALPALAAQMQCCPTCAGSGRLPGIQPPV